MLANDAPESVIPAWGKISLPEYLDANHGGDGWPCDIIAWHITDNTKINSIMANGLRASNCASWSSRGYDRPHAVYLFCAESVLAANIKHILDNPANAIIVKVVIPAAHVGKLHIDNLYNISIDDADMTAIQYRDNIPPEWIVSQSPAQPL